MAQGQWMRTQLAHDDNSKTSAQSSEQTVTYDLPKSNYLGHVQGHIEAQFSGGTNPTVRVDLNRVRVIANGRRSIIDLEGDQLSAITKIDQGRAPTDDGSASSSPSDEHFTILFGRDVRDETVLCPAPKFSSLQLELTFDLNTSGSPTIDDVLIDLSTDEFVSPLAPSNFFMKRQVLLETKSSISNDQAFGFDVPPGNPVRRFYTHTDNDANIEGDPVSVDINNGTQTPFEQRREQIEEDMLSTYRFHDETIPAAGVSRGQNVFVIDFDVASNLQKLLQVAPDDDLKVNCQAASSGASGEVALIVEEVVPIRDQGG